MTLKYKKNDFLNLLQGEGFECIFNFCEKKLISLKFNWIEE